MDLSERFDYQEAGRQASIGWVIFVVSEALSCLATSWFVWEYVKYGSERFSFWTCTPLSIPLIGMVFGGVKLWMNMWEQGEIEARANLGL